MPRECDIAVIGAGAAGLMAAISAGRALRASGGGTVVAIDGARRIGAKILVAGGGRCNVTHDAVDETAYSGSSRPAIRKVLGRFGVDRTVEFFRELGVELKREDTGKLFPVTDNAHTVLDALLAAAGDAGAELLHPWRVDAIDRAERGFVIRRARESGEPVDDIHARRVILATGGKSLPKTGSDGQGYTLARSLGHSITPRVFPALVPLTLPKDHFIVSLSGLTVPTTVEVRDARGKCIAAFTDSTLCAHFGLSGPAILDISRYWTAAGPEARLLISWLPGVGHESLDRELLAAKGIGIGRWLSGSASHAASVVGHRDRGMPERLARALCEQVALDPGTPVNLLTREQRRAIVAGVTEMALPVTGDRGFLHAEVTAGGVPLSEVHLDTMESRVCPGLYLCGEICDVDGRIGGYNFQWAWASGYAAGSAAAAAEP
ncbi:MAG: aminoacetone oxidase family FAD-binding enzyme [Phycisphaerales bacterium]|nr:aminoacetone oxidase family FAD-binding enzyme [Phycisphaerales bacterium]